MDRGNNNNEAIRADYERIHGAFHDKIEAGVNYIGIVRRRNVFVFEDNSTIGFINNIDILYRGSSDKFTDFAKFICRKFSENHEPIRNMWTSNNRATGRILLPGGISLNIVGACHIIHCIGKRWEIEKFFILLSSTLGSDDILRNEVDYFFSFDINLLEEALCDCPDSVKHVFFKRWSRIRDVLSLWCVKDYFWVVPHFIQYIQSNHITTAVEPHLGRIFIEMKDCTEEKRKRLWRIVAQKLDPVEYFKVLDNGERLQEYLFAFTKSDYHSISHENLICMLLIAQREDLKNIWKCISVHQNPITMLFERLFGKQIIEKYFQYFTELNFRGLDDLTFWKLMSVEFDELPFDDVNLKRFWKFSRSFNGYMSVLITKPKAFNLFFSLMDASDFAALSLDQQNKILKLTQNNKKRA
ncbi:hypothetical protein PCE1_003813 [Barthelona sp. PCE]